MNVIKVHDKLFRPFIPFEKIEEQVKRMAWEINKDLEGQVPLFLSVLNGSFMFAADLLKNITLDCEISFVKLASYSGTESTQLVRQLIGFDEDIYGRTVVVVEDIVDSGLTMERVLEQLKDMGAHEIKVATLMFKPDAFKGDYDIHYKGFDIGNEFIIGYGLDYNRQGRNLKDIYIIEE
ncbi:MAG: hypoxanthine phosphoribosyltransferase [Marinilabiliales bacterium]|nr:MAG: hypoxanthine phosphoribosyltransferase [Marinilabiliales bacterium]